MGERVVTGSILSFRGIIHLNKFIPQCVNSKKKNVDIYIKSRKNDFLIFSATRVMSFRKELVQ